MMMFAWSSLTPAGSGAEMVVLQRSDHGRAIAVEVGAIVVVELEEKGATGYLWLLDALDQMVFDLVGVESRAGGETGKMGAPVVKVWRLQARQRGRTVLEFSYCRPWKGKEASLDRFMVEVTIQ